MAYGSFERAGSLGSRFANCRMVSVAASIEWLAKRDPYRNVEPWLDSRPTWVDTPRTGQTLAVEAERAHNIRTLYGQFVHTHRVDLSGGVMIRPSLRVARAADGSLIALRQAILRSRFAGAIQW